MAGKPKPLQGDELFEYALRALGGRAHSIGELREKLRKRCAEPADIDPVLERLKEAGYLNDRRFAELFAATRKETGSFGKMRVLRDLRQRRVAPPVAEGAVNQAFSDADETVMIEAFLDRKYKNKNLSDQKTLASAYRRLRYAGFSSGASIRVLKRRAADSEMLDTLAED